MHLSSVDIHDPYGRRSFIHPIELSSQGKKYQSKALADTGATAWSFIDEKEAQTVSEYLDIVPIPLPKPRYLSRFDGKIRKKPVTHALYVHMRVGNHFELTVPMFITQLGNQDIILGKSWINSHKVVLDMSDDRIIFLPGRCDHYGAPQVIDPNDLLLLKTTSDIKPCDSKSVTPSCMETTKSAPRGFAPSIPNAIIKRQTALISTAVDIDHPPKPKPKSKPISTTVNINEFSSLQDEPEAPLKIYEIGVPAFHMLTRNQRKHQVRCFWMTLAGLDRSIEECLAPPPDNTIRETVVALMETVKQKLPPEYHDSIDVFDKAKAKELPPHRSYDHKIDIEPGKVPPKCRIYPMSEYKLQKVKEYLEKNLSKRFISSSTAPYASPVLFVQKKDDSLRFCVDYRKLNAMTIRNRDPIPLIEETLARVIGCKYLIKLDVIAAFNKLRMHPDSEDFTTFVTSIVPFKYHVLPFGLTRSPGSYQQYKNDTMFDFLNDFCQVYLDDILIYSKTKKTHREHVRKVLLKL